MGDISESWKEFHETKLNNFGGAWFGIKPQIPFWVIIFLNRIVNFYIRTDWDLDYKLTSNLIGILESRLTELSRLSAILIKRDFGCA